MIVTEYVENGSLDAFLRVRAPWPVSRAGTGKVSLGVLGSNVRPPSAPETWTQQLWGRESQLQSLNGQPVTLPLNPTM